MSGRYVEAMTSSASDASFEDTNLEICDGRKDHSAKFLLNVFKVFLFHIVFVPNILFKSIMFGILQHCYS